MSWQGHATFFHSNYGHGITCISSYFTTEHGAWRTVGSHGHPCHVFKPAGWGGVTKGHTRMLFGCCGVMHLGALSLLLVGNTILLLYWTPPGLRDDEAFQLSTTRPHLEPRNTHTMLNVPHSSSTDPVLPVHYARLHWLQLSALQQGIFFHPSLPLVLRKVLTTQAAL